MMKARITEVFIRAGEAGVPELRFVNGEVCDDGEVVITPQDFGLVIESETRGVMHPWCEVVAVHFVKEEV